MAAREALLAPLTDPNFCPEVFATGFVVQRISTACIRLNFYTDGMAERPIVAKIIRPIPLLIAGPQLLRMAEEAIRSIDLH